MSTDGINHTNKWDNSRKQLLDRCCSQLRVSLTGLMFVAIQIANFYEATRKFFFSKAYYMFIHVKMVLYQGKITKFWPMIYALTCLSDH